MLFLASLHSSVDRAVGFYPIGRGFESFWGRFYTPVVNWRFPRSGGVCPIWRLPLIQSDTALNNAACRENVVDFRHEKRPVDQPFGNPEQLKPAKQRLLVSSRSVDSRHSATHAKSPHLVPQTGATTEPVNWLTHPALVTRIRHQSRTFRSPDSCRATHLPYQVRCSGGNLRTSHWGHSPRI